jgi:lysophospholipase L1-like esterase
MSKSKQRDLEEAAIKNYLLPFLNLHKQHPLLPGAQSVRGQAAFIGLDEKVLADARISFGKITKNAALDLLKDEDVMEWVLALPFRKSDTIMVIGDSLTDDLQGWFEIFKHVVEIGVDDSRHKFVNAAVYGSTSLDALRRTDRDLALNKPNWVIIALGSHDAQRLHAASDRTLVSIAEFWENISTIEAMVSEITKNPIIWLTPPPTVEELMQDMPLFPGVILEKDLSQYREVIAGKMGYVIDPHGHRLGQPAAAWNYLADGFHVSVAGHTETAKLVLRTLASDKELPVQDNSSMDFDPEDDY